MRMTTTGSEGLPEKEASAELQVRRWETLEQWEQRMGEKWKGAVYFNLFSKKDGHSVYIDGKYQTHTAEDALEIIDRLENKQHCHDYRAIVICANSDNGRPPDGWMPDETIK